MLTSFVSFLWRNLFWEFAGLISLICHMMIFYFESYILIGLFLQKSTYYFLFPDLCSLVGMGEWWHCLWKLSLLPHIKVFYWKLLHHHLLLADRLAKIGFGESYVLFVLLSLNLLSVIFFYANYLILFQHLLNWKLNLFYPSLWCNWVLDCWGASVGGEKWAH